MKNVYLIQPNNSLSDSLFLPYAVGSIAAYAFRDDEIRSSCRLCNFIYKKQPAHEVLAAMSEPFAVGFSCYMWNVEYNLMLAEEIKNSFPDAVIIFGGPQIPDDTEYLEKYGFIDILIHGEGEIAFTAVLKHLLSGTPMQTTDNISFRENGKPVKTPHSAVCSLDSFPSPYSEGLFDGIINDPANAGIQFDAIIETNRGCPYKCIYCCWAGNKDTFRKFPDERIKQDLEWIAKNRISYCICADSNFGILERDEKIADYIIELKNQYGYPQKFETTAAKNKDDLLFNINKKLDSANLNRGISVAVQSMSETVLEIIGRKNMPVDNLAEQLERYRKAGMYTYTDIILGLPGETFESFSKGLFDVIEAGQHYSININRCEFLPNTPMYTEEFRKKYGIKTIRSFLCQNHSKIARDMRFGSRSDLVVETNTMSRSDWRKAIRLSVCVQSFHCLGLLRFAAIYLRKSCGVSYRDFYMSLFGYIETSNGFIKNTLDYVCASVDEFLAHNGNLSFADKRFGDIYWPFEEALFLCLVCDAEEFYREIGGYFRACGYADNIAFNDLFNYQRSIISAPGICENTLTFEYDWPEFFDAMFDPALTEPKKQNVTLTLSADNSKNKEEYARHTVWYGKRSNKTVREITKINKA